MMAVTVLDKIKTASPSRREIFRYAGGREDSAELSALLDECLNEALPQISGRICYGEFEIKETESGVDFGFCTCDSRDLKKNLSGCSRAVVFAATVGIGIDRLILKYSAISPARALMCQAIGAERIEALCDEFCLELCEKGYHLKPRFSAGYGDLPLEFQRDIFKVLEPEKNIGLTLNSSLLMTPSKSVTAVIGIL